MEPEVRTHDASDAPPAAASGAPATDSCVASLPEAFG